MAGAGRMTADAIAAKQGVSGGARALNFSEADTRGVDETFRPRYRSRATKGGGAQTR